MSFNKTFTDKPPDYTCVNICVKDISNTVRVKGTNWTMETIDQIHVIQILKNLIQVKKQRNMK